MNAFTIKRTSVRPIRLSRRALLLSSAVLLGATTLVLPGHAQDLGPAATKSDSGSGFGSIYCGPRCVQRVLREYDIETELIELIREMQWPDVEKGTSFHVLAMALQKRGISTRAVDLDPLFDIEWPYPAIVHLEQNGVAHYVVWMPPTEPGTSGRVWDNEVTDAVRGKFNALRTGPVLLTSEVPIPDSAVVARRIRVSERQRRLNSALPWAVGAAGLACGWLLQRHASGRDHSGQRSGIAPGA